MVKPDGNIRDHYRYDAYGNSAPGNTNLSSDGANVLHNTFGYTGEMCDEESNLLYLRARYYEPETGRFLSRDTYAGQMNVPLSKNLYVYVVNNPTNFVDSTGNWASSVEHDWTASTHRMITGRALDIFAKAENVSKSFKDEITKTYREAVLNGSDDADTGAFPYQNHFWDPNNKEENYLGDPNDTAVTQLEKWYNIAVERYRSARKDFNSDINQRSKNDPSTWVGYRPLSSYYFQAYVALGKAVHYLQDLENHYHTSSMVNLNFPEVVGIGMDSDHSDYEGWAQKEIMEDWRSGKMDYVATSVDYDWHGTVAELGEYAGRRSSIPATDGRWLKHKDFVDYFYFDKTRDDLKRFIKQSQRDTARVFYMFYEDVR